MNKSFGRSSAILSPFAAFFMSFESPRRGLSSGGTRIVKQALDFLGKSSSTEFGQNVRSVAKKIDEGDT